MNQAKFLYQGKNYNDDINIHHNGTPKLDYKSLSMSNKTNLGVSYNNLNIKNKNKNEDFKYSNNNISSSLKDEILSPGDDDISSNFDKNKISMVTPYLDDDIVYNKYNYFYLTKNKNSLSLLNNQIIKSNDDYLDINSKLNQNQNVKKIKKTLILDLDETLVHSSFKPINFNNIFIKPDIFLKINFRGNNHNVYVLKRPYVYEFLKEMNKIYNIMIFTASVKEYANPLLDTLDTEKVIKQRLFREDCCVGPNRKYIKDLKILNMNLKDLILVDNYPISYSYNKSNGIPIKTWHFDKTDQELVKLIPVLQFLANVNDVRDYIPKLVENDEIDFSKINFMIKEFNNENEQNKFLRPRAKSQKKILASNKGKNNSYIYNYKDINNNIGDDSNVNNTNNNNINQRQKYEDSKINKDEINKNKYINNYNNYNNYFDDEKHIYNTQINNNTNMKNEYTHNYERNIIDYNGKNKYYKDKTASSNYDYNNYMKNNNNINTNINNNNLINENSNNNLNIKEQSNYQSNIFKNEEDKEQVIISKQKIDLIQRYSMKNNLNNNYIINEFRNQNQNQRNKSNDISNNIIKDRNRNNNNDLNMNNTNCTDKIVNKCNNVYKDLEINNNYYIKEKYINNNYLNNIQTNNENNKKNNYVFNYESKVSYGFITPQINNNKFISNYSINNYSTKNSNMNSNRLSINNNNITQSKNINYNLENKNNIDVMNNNFINKNNNNSNYNQLYKDTNKKDYINNDYKYNNLQKSSNNKDTTENTGAKINFNLKNINEYNIHDIHSNTALNFYSSKISNNNNIIYNSPNLNFNSNAAQNLNKNLNVIQNKEETKINNIANGQVNNDLKIDNNIKKQISPSIISKETNYYRKRRMILNKEKIALKKKENENMNGLYVFFNGKKIEINNNNENIDTNNINNNNNKNNYYNMGKYHKNEIYFYANKNY